MAAESGWVICDWYMTSRQAIKMMPITNGTVLLPSFMAIALCPSNGDAIIAADCKAPGESDLQQSVNNNNKNNNVVRSAPGNKLGGHTPCRVAVNDATDVPLSI